MVKPVGPNKWKLSTMTNLSSSKGASKKCNLVIDNARRHDPLPTFREQILLESNDKIFSYMRGVREVVKRLRESLGSVNAEIKYLLRCKDTLEKSFEHIRKDIKLNTDTVNLRKNRPMRESDRDEADNLLLGEKRELNDIKRGLESKLRQVQRQLSELSNSRSRVSAVLEERNEILEFLAVHAANGRAYKTHMSDAIRQIGPEEFLPDGIAEELLPLIDTPESQTADKESHECTHRSSELRREVKLAIGDAHVRAKDAHENVNDGLMQKVAETVTLEQKLDLARGKNRKAVHKLERHKNLTETAKGYVDGPESQENLTTREYMNRPLVKAYHRHPNTTITDTRRIIRASTTLGISIEESRKNIEMLVAAKNKLNADLKDKRAATATDTALVRLRRRRASHRWVMDKVTADPTIEKAATTAWRDAGSHPRMFVKK